MVPVHPVCFSYCRHTTGIHCGKLGVCFFLVKECRIIKKRTAVNTSIVTIDLLKLTLISSFSQHSFIPGCSWKHEQLYADFMSLWHKCCFACKMYTCISQPNLLAYLIYPLAWVLSTFLQPRWNCQDNL